MCVSLDAIVACDSLMRPPEDGNLISETYAGATNTYYYVNNLVHLLV
jgi:hypothetical protein